MYKNVSKLKKTMTYDVVRINNKLHPFCHHKLVISLLIFDYHKAIFSNERTKDQAKFCKLVGFCFDVEKNKCAINDVKLS